MTAIFMLLCVDDGVDDDDGDFQVVVYAVATVVL